MTLRDLIPVSCFATIDTVRKGSIGNLEILLMYNLSLIKFFDKVVLAINRADDVSDEEYYRYKDMWSINVPNIIILEESTNDGHMFGTIKLEETILQYVKKKFPGVSYIFKSMADVITTFKMLDQEVPKVDFYYLPGFSNESIKKAGSSDKLKEQYEDFEAGFYTPQTTFYILNIDNIDSIYGTDVWDKKLIYDNAKKDVSPDLKPWEMSFDVKFDCETHLGRTTKNMSKYCIISKEFDRLLNVVSFYNIGDPSHKNLLFDRVGICHYHFVNMDVMSL